jgi:polar amino acid transport system substrate-binding protein
LVKQTDSLKASKTQFLRPLMRVSLLTCASRQLMKPLLNTSANYRLMTVVLCLAGALASNPISAHADLLEQIKQRGKIVVGVKKDVPLWGMQNITNGRIEGLEPDLAEDIARRLGVKLELRGLTTDERVPALQSEQVDVLIATLSHTPEREKILTLVAPDYYASGVSVLAKKRDNFSTWEELRNRRICSRRGAFYNRLVTVKYGINLVALYNNQGSINALQDGRCDGLLYDDTNIIALLQTARWSGDHEMRLPTLYVTPWSIALKVEERGGALEQVISRAVVDWHRTGRLLALEQQWKIPASTFALKKNQLWQQKKSDGSYFCGEKISPNTPKECR